MFIKPSKKSVKIINDSQIFNCRDMGERRNRSSYQEKEEEKKKKKNTHRLQKVFLVEWTIQSWSGPQSRSSPTPKLQAVFDIYFFRFFIYYI